MLRLVVKKMLHVGIELFRLGGVVVVYDFFLSFSWLLCFAVLFK